MQRSGNSAEYKKRAKKNENLSNYFGEYDDTVSGYKNQNKTHKPKSSFNF